MIGIKRFLCCIIVFMLLFSGCNSAATSNMSETVSTTASSSIPQTSNTTEADNTSEILPPQIAKHPPAADFTIYMNNGKKLQSLPSFNPDSLEGWQVDLRSTDLTLLDLRNREFDLLNSVFDSKTKWPEKLPQGFDPKVILDSNKNPGFNIKKLHNEGITGKGINIAIIDYALLVDHDEYKDRVKMYEEVHCLDKQAQMHAPLVASIAAGKTVGVAPEANLYFIGCSNYMAARGGGTEIDFTWDAKAVERIIEVNKTLPEDQKIRVLSMSVGWSPDLKGYNEITEAVKKAVDQGIFVISANMFETYDNEFYFNGLDIDTLSDRDDPSSYYVIPWEKWMSKIAHIGKFTEYYENKLDEDNPREILLIPTETKTTASPTGTSDYVFYRQGGWSMVMPYLAGMYALACQAKPDITPQVFWDAALKTGVSSTIQRNNKNYTGKIIDPEKLIERLKNMK